jgi:pimeloyl-ACP methyl ester carboxylesterase
VLKVLERKRLLPNGLHQIGIFDPNRPTVVFVHGAFLKPSEHELYMQTAQDSDQNVLILKYDTVAPLLKTAESFTAQLKDIYQKTNARITLAGFSNGSRVVFKTAILLWDGGDKKLVGRTNMVLVGPILEGTYETTLRSSIKYWPNARPDNLIPYASSISPGNDDSLEFQSRFREIRENLAGYSTLTSKIDQNYRRRGLFSSEDHYRFEKQHKLFYLGGRELNVKHDRLMEGSTQAAVIFSEMIQEEKNDRAMKAAEILERAAKANGPGGIDLTSNKFLQTQNQGQGIEFHMDPAMFEQLKNAPGFTPVIINIQPLNDLRGFLGINHTNSEVKLAQV